MVPRSPPSTSMTAHEKSSNGLTMTNKSISKSLAVDDAGSELCRLSLETSSCEKAQGDEKSFKWCNNNSTSV